MYVHSLASQNTKDIELMVSKKYKRRSERLGIRPRDSLSATRTLHSQIVIFQWSTSAISKVVEGRSSREIDNVSSIQAVILRSVE